LLHTFSNASQTLLSAAFNLFLEWGLGKAVLLEDRRKCLLLYWFSLMLWNICLK
jgi:hypothetical protein